MIAYKNLDDICEGVAVWHLMNDEGHAKLKKCVKVYWAAYYDPPVVWLVWAGSHTQSNS